MPIRRRRAPLARRISGQARSSTGSPLRASWRPMKTIVVLAPLGLRPLGNDDAVGDDLEPGPSQRLADSAAIRETAIRASIRSVEEAPGPAGAPHPAERSGRVPGRRDPAAGERERGDADRRRHRLVEMDDVEALLVEHRAHPADRPRREHDVRERAVRGYDDRAPDGDDPLGKLAVAAAARVEEARHVPGRIVAHDDLARRARGDAGRAAWFSACSTTPPQ